MAPLANDELVVPRNDTKGRKNVVCALISESQLTAEQQADLHVFYWAAYYGDLEACKIMTLTYRWSPMMKSFRERDTISGAVLGQQADVVAFLFSLSYLGKNDVENAQL